jgi:hypothetical protein
MRKLVNSVILNFKCSASDAARYRSLRCWDMFSSSLSQTIRRALDLMYDLSKPEKENSAWRTVSYQAFQAARSCIEGSTTDSGKGKTNDPPTERGGDPAKQRHGTAFDPLWEVVEKRPGPALGDDLDLDEPRPLDAHKRGFSSMTDLDIFKHFSRTRRGKLIAKRIIERLNEHYPGRQDNLSKTGPAAKGKKNKSRARATPRPKKKKG